jgi:hypothetical protein
MYATFVSRGNWSTEKSQKQTTKSLKFMDQTLFHRKFEFQLVLRSSLRCCESVCVQYSNTFTRYSNITQASLLAGCIIRWSLQRTLVQPALYFSQTYRVSTTTNASSSGACKGPWFSLPFTLATFHRVSITTNASSSGACLGSVCPLL